MGRRDRRSSLSAHIERAASKHTKALVFDLCEWYEFPTQRRADINSLSVVISINHSM